MSGPGVGGDGLAPDTHLAKGETMATVTVRNVSGETVLIGERYLFPAEMREVDGAAVDPGDKRLLVVGATVDAAEAKPVGGGRRRAVR